MDLQDQNNFQKVVAFFWGEKNAKSIPMTNRAVTAVEDALAVVAISFRK